MADNELFDEDASMNFGSSPPKAKSASPRAKSASPKKASPKAPRKGFSYAGSPSAKGVMGNYIVSPRTSKELMVRKKDPRTGEMVYNKLYKDLIDEYGQDIINALPRYETKDEAVAAAKAQSAANKAAGVGKDGEAKGVKYYFNTVSKRVAKKYVAGESHPEPFATQYEARLWAFNNGYTKTKPTQTKKDPRSLPGAENIRFFIRADRNNQGSETNVFVEWIGRDKQLSATARNVLALGGTQPKKLYTWAERDALSKAKSDAGKKASSNATPADVEAAVKRARARGVKEETIEKILNNSQSNSGKVSTLNLQKSGGGPGGPGVYAVKRSQNEQGKWVKAKGARANRMWGNDGVPTKAARDFVKYYYAMTGKEISAKQLSDMSDDQIIAALEAAFKAGILSREERV
jgi:hypothetical protein